MTVTCPSCQTTLAAPGGFCSRCGAPLGGAAAPAAGARTSRLAVASLVCGLLFCLPGLNLLLGVALGVWALIAISQSGGRLTGQAYAIAGIVVPVATVPIIGILAAIAIPNFIKYQARARMGEARVSLRSLATAEQAYYAAHGAFAPVGPVPDHLPQEPEVVALVPGVPSDFGWTPPPRTRFQYRATVQGSGAGASVHLSADAAFAGLHGSPAHLECDLSPEGSCSLEER